MDRLEAIGMLKAKLECITRETSGIDLKCNRSDCDDCHLNYDQGNMGQHKIYLKMAIEALEDIYGISNALDKITYHEGCTYGFDDDVKNAMKWLEREDERFRGDDKK